MPRRTAILLVVVCAVFVAIGILILVRTPEQRALGLGCIAFFGAGVLVGVAQLLSTRVPAPDADGTVTFVADRAQMIAMAIGCAGLSVGCAFIAGMAWADGAVIGAAITWIGLPFFGIGAAVLARRTLKLEPLLELDRDGVTQFGPNGWRLPWRAIRSVEVLDVESTRFLVLEADSTAAPPRGTAGRLTAALAGSPYTLTSSGTGVSFEALQALVLEYWQRGR